MKAIFQWLLVGLVTVILSSCGGAPSDTTGDSNASDTQNASLLEGGTINNPTPLEFEKTYNLPEAYKTYVKIEVKQFQRITFDIATNEKNHYGYYPAKVYDLSGNKVANHVAYGDTNAGHHNTAKSMTQDFIFLKVGAYLFEFTFKVSTHSDATKSRLIAHNVGITQLPKVQNKGTYSGSAEDHKYFGLEIKKDGDINLHGDRQRNGDYYSFNSIIYDYDLNIIESFDSVRDINITLPQGNYLFHPTSGDCTITFLNP